MLLCCVIILNVIILNVIILSVIMLNVIMLSVIILRVIMLSVIKLNVIILSVVAPKKQHQQMDLESETLRKFTKVLQNFLRSFFCLGCDILLATRLFWLS